MKKEITIELVNDIHSIIKMQEYCISNLKKTACSQSAIDFEEDILRVLKAVSKVSKMDCVNLDAN